MFYNFAAVDLFEDFKFNVMLNECTMQVMQCLLLLLYLLWLPHTDNCNDRQCLPLLMLLNGQLSLTVCLISIKSMNLARMVAGAKLDTPWPAQPRPV